MFIVFLLAKLAGRSFESYEKWLFFGVSSRLGPFPQVFRQVKEWLILQLHEVIRVLHAVACQVVFILSYEQGWQGECSKLLKYIFFSVFSRLGFSSQVFEQVDKSDKNNKSATCSWVSNCFILFYDRYWQGGVFKRMKNYHFLNTFSCFGVLTQVFGRVNDWSILGVHKMIRVLHVVACPLVFILFYGRD